MDDAALDAEIIPDGEDGSGFQFGMTQFSPQ